MAIYRPAIGGNPHSRLVHPEYGGAYEDMTGKDAAAHEESCTWRKACELVAALTPDPTPDEANE